MSKQDFQIAVNPMAFPDHLATDKEKESMEYGLKCGQAIQYEWFRKDQNTAAPFYTRWRQFHLRRLYARGEQPVDKYKNQIATDGDLSHINLDWTPVPILPEFVDIIVNGISERLFKVKAVAKDAVSAEKRSKYQDQIEGQMVAKDVLMNVQENFGINPFTMDPDELPGNDEELAVHMQLKYKPAIEIAEEIAIGTVFDENRLYDLIKRAYYDITTVGMGMLRHRFIIGEGIQIDYADPANMVWSYTEDPRFRDCFYWGEVKNVPVSELYKIKPDITKEEIDQISRYGQAWYKYYNLNGPIYDSIYTKDTTTLLFFNYKTTKKIVYKKKKLEGGASRIIEKDDTFNPPTEKMSKGSFEKIEKTIDVWYEGVMVMGTNILLSWQLQENMIRPKSASQHPLPNYIACAPRMYKGNIESQLQRMIPFADQIQLSHLKLQQVKARMVPDGVFIDADGINQVDLGTGGSYTPEDALRLYFQTGSVIGRSYTEDGEFNHARIPIQELTTNSGYNKIQSLITSMNHDLDMLMKVTGLNDARTAANPDPRSLVGVQKLAALNSNTATRHILDGGLSIVQGMAEAVSLRVADLLQYNDTADEFANQIGKYNVAILKEIKDLYLCDFGIFIEISPDEEQKAQLEANIQIALQSGGIDLEDAIDIRETNNIKLANQLLKVKRKQKMERDMRDKMMLQQQQQQTQLQTQQMAAQAALQKIQAETQSKVQIEQAKVAFEIEKQNNEANLKSKLMAEEFQYKLELEKLYENRLTERDQMKEDEKANRISQQNSQESQLINQRKYDTAPVNFESSNDSIDGFGLEQFAPR